MTSTGPIRVLVVDDSAFNRRVIADCLSASPEIEVVGKASDGEQALRLVASLEPDAVTLDLEMPKIDGFTFLRILMSRTPLPVVVVSSYSQKENVFRALELGALDFVAKPDRLRDATSNLMCRELVSRLLLARNLRSPLPLRPRAPFPEAPERRPARDWFPPRRVVAIASSTGGPSALMELFTRLPTDTSDAFVIAQHMPDKFTRTFAERLNKHSGVRVTEAADGDRLGRGMALLCPGRHCMELRGESADTLFVRVSPPAPTDRYVPSGDRLITSVANVMGARTLGIILTGMGDDGTSGARAVLQAGGSVIAESETTAVVNGMPGAAVRAGVASHVLPLGGIADFLAAEVGS